MAELYNPPLQVIGFIATRVSDSERGPQISLNAFEAHVRMVNPEELIWVYGPRSHNLAAVIIDDTIPRGGIVARDLPGVLTTDIVRLVRINTDRPLITPSLA